MLQRLTNYLTFSILAPFIYLIYFLNPDWLDVFNTHQKRILDNWNGITNIKTKVFFLYLAARFISFNKSDFFIKLEHKDIVIGVLTFVFSILFAFLGILILFSVRMFPNIEGIIYMFGIGLILSLGSVGLLIANADVYAALYLRKLTEQN